MPDREIGLGPRRPRVGRGRRWPQTGELARDHRDLGRATVVVGHAVPREVLVPQHREVRLDHLVGGGQVEPDLEQLGDVRALAVEQREHLAVHDALARGEPLHVAAAEARGRAERVGVVDEAVPHERDRLEAAVRVLREAGHRRAVVHAPAVDAGEVHADVAPGERRVRTDLRRCRRG